MAMSKEAPARIGMKVPDKQAMEMFLNNGIAMMKREDTRELLKSKAVTAPGLKLIELQRVGWDSLGIDRDIGCYHLERVHDTCAGDVDILQLREAFVMEAKRCFVRALEDRRPVILEKKKKMSRDVIVQFFDACNIMMDLPETSLRLKKHLEKTGKFANTFVIELQRDMLEVLGFEKDHGCAMLSNISKDFRGDRELFERFEDWRMKATQFCQRVIMAHEAANGGVMPMMMASTPDMEKLQVKAKKEIEAMTPLERGEFLEKMKKKMEVFMKFPMEGRKIYMGKLSEEEKLRLVKAQILLVSMMRQQAQDGSGSTMAPQ